MNLAKTSSVLLNIYNISGRLIKNISNGKVWDAGSHSVCWDGTDENGTMVASGVYFYRLVTPTFQATKQMIVLKYHS